MGFKQKQSMNKEKHDRIRLLRLALVAGLVLLIGATAPQDWELLGARTVKHSLDRDEITVTAREGMFRRIKLKVRNTRVTFRKVLVHFGDGGVQEVELRRQIPAGGETRAIDLKGGRRVIRKVVFWYNTPQSRRKKAVVQLFGLR